MDAVTTRDADDPTTGPSLVFDEKAHAHSVAEDVLGILTGTFLASLGLHLLHAVPPSPAGPRGSRCCSGMRRRGRSGCCSR